MSTSTAVSQPDQSVHISPDSPDRPRTPWGAAPDRVLRAAEELFYTRGINRVGIESIITRAGVAKMSLYNHFPSKDHLVLAYLHRTSQALLPHFWQKVAVVVPPPANTNESPASPAALAAHAASRLIALFDVINDWCAHAHFRGCPFLNAAAELADPNHLAHAAIRAHKDRVHALLAREAAAAGASDPNALAHQLAILLDGAMTSAAISHQTDPLDHATQAARTLIHAATTNPTHSPSAQ